MRRPALLVRHVPTAAAGDTAARILGRLTGRRYDYCGAVYVVDGEGRPLGVIPPHALYRVLRREHVEDLHRIAGIRRETSHILSPMGAAPIRRVRDRLPWLLARSGKDPALGSGPLATIFRDVLSLLVYFLTVSVIVF